MTAASLRRMLSEYPHLVAEFHPTKNAALTPETVSYDGGGRIWWQCAHRHEWHDTPNRRTRGRNCPFCAGERVTLTHPLAARYPRVADTWHPTKNGTQTPHDVTFGSHRLAWWQCPKSPDHVWRCSVQYRTTHGCPFCAAKRVCTSNSLSTCAPDVAREWHPTKNKPHTPQTVVVSSQRRVWWRCSENHEWTASIASRGVLRRQCPGCINRKVTSTNNLAARAPGALRFWHPSKNLPLTPSDLVAGTRRRVWWRCQEGPDHEWEATVYSQTLRNGRCPFCAHTRLSITNSLAVRHPRVAAEWHPSKNGALSPRDVMSGSRGKVWWLCPLGHEWEAYIANRTTQGSGCPTCVHAARTRKRRTHRWRASSSLTRA